DCDFMTASAYKFYGPHASVFYGKKDLLESIDFPKLQPAPDTAPARAEMGTQNHEGIAGAAAAVDFYASLVAQAVSLRPGSHEGSTGSDSHRVITDRRERLQSSFAGLREHSRPQVKRLWEELSRIKGVRLYGPTPDVDRTPTVSFTIE